MQSRCRPFLVACSILAPFGLSGAAGGADSLVYELREGSYLLDGCLACDRAEFRLPLGGTFRLTQSYIGNVVVKFDVEEFRLETLDGRYAVQGTGEYSGWLAAPRPTGQQLSMTLEIGGTAGIKLDSELEVTSTPFPAVDILIREDGQRDPLHIFTLRLVAAPPAQPPAAPVAYEIGPGSMLVDDCVACGRPPLEAPITGSFLLARIDQDYPFAPFPREPVYRIDRLDLRAVSPALDYRLRGAGTLLRQEERSTEQEVLLDLAVNGSTGRVFAGGASTDPPPAFPALDLKLVEKDPSGIQVLSLRLLAKPAPTADVAFRRGDPNADRSVDIGDALAILFYLFGGGEGVPCEKSADVNDSGAIEITDAIRLLSFLFLAGPPPESPFPSCGQDPSPDVVICAATSPPCE